jgi:hypothetical protein
MRHVLLFGLVALGVSFFAVSLQKPVSAVLQDSAYPPPKEEIGINECRYDCVDGMWNLTVGNPSPGFSCPPSLGTCVEGDMPTVIPAEPDMEQDTDVDTRVSDSAGMYRFVPSRNELRFVRGKAEKGFGFCPVVSLDQLVILYPETAASILSDSSRLTSTFTIELPALAFEDLAKVAR